MFDESRDFAYIQLTAEWKANPEGSSVMLLPSHSDVPVRIDLYLDAEDRLEGISIEKASRYLVPDALATAVPLVPPHD